MRWTVVCECGWKYTNVVKTDVEQQARNHRVHGCRDAAQQVLV